VTVAFAPDGITERQARVLATMLAAQERLVAGFEGVEALAAGEAELPPRRFGDHGWRRPAGGGGRARVIEGGRVFERGGVNVSAVVGERVPPTLAAQHPGTEGKPWFATGVSLVMHPRNPHVPAFHANFRYFEVGGAEAPTGALPDDGAVRQAAPAEPAAWWFGGGADLTPAYPVEDDVRAFHAALAGWCSRHPQADYPAWKATCDAYFTVRHRGEMRGVGGVFFDELTPPCVSSPRDETRADPGRTFEADLACVEDGIATLLPAYLPIVERRRHDPYGERERRWQALRRGRYVEFNLVYDRGTLFGLQTGGHIEAILMSMPPLAGWAFDHHPEPGSPEAAALAFYQPRDWGHAETTPGAGPATTRRTA
jgi:coproporphyrinogen III oxidase